MCIHYLRDDLAPVLGIEGEVAQCPGRLLLHARALGVAAHRRDQGSDPPLRVCVCACVCVCDCRLRNFFWEVTYVFMCIHYLRDDLAPVLGIEGEVAQCPGRLLLHARALGVAAHRRHQGLDPPLCA